MFYQFLSCSYLHHGTIMEPIWIESHPTLSSPWRFHPSRSIAPTLRCLTWIGHDSIHANRCHGEPTHPGSAGSPQTVGSGPGHLSLPQCVPMPISTVALKDLGPPHFPPQCWKRRHNNNCNTYFRKPCQTTEKKTWFPKSAYIKYDQ